MSKLCIMSLDGDFETYIVLYGFHCVRTEVEIFCYVFRVIDGGYVLIELLCMHVLK